jgi:predicted dehydrogenase
LQKLRVGVVGAGRMGRIRSLSAKAHPQSELVEVVDTIAEHARSLAVETGCRAGDDWQKLIEREDVDAVIVATPHKHLAPITTAALKAGKHVFCEKPMARNLEEAEAVLATIREQARTPNSAEGPKVLIGYTLRHHPAIQRAWQMVQTGDIGRPFFIRGRYGHGARPNYDKEWRTNPEESGGGELLDQGVHLVDLSRCFLGHFSEVMGFAECFHWARESSKVEDNAFLLMRTPDCRVASLHASWTQWKNLFSFEIFGEKGAAIVQGLGGSYGTEKLLFVRRLNVGAPEVEEVLYPSEGSHDLDDVWAVEWGSFVEHVNSANASRPKNGLLPATPQDAREVLAIVQSVTGSSSAKQSPIPEPTSEPPICRVLD